MVFDKLLLLGRDVDRLSLDGVRVGRGGRPVDGGDELGCERAVVTDRFKRVDQLRPVPGAVAARHPVVVGHVEVDEAVAAVNDGLVGVLFLDVDVEGIETDAALRPDFFSQGEGLGTPG